jgi:hypothetical protein
MEAMPPLRANSGKEHLEVWRSLKKRRPVGLEFDHDAHVNLWLVRTNVPQTLPAAVVAVRIEPKGSRWTDSDEKRANSNLNSYEEFQTKHITLLTVSSIENARIVLDALLP